MMPGNHPRKLFVAANPWPLAARAQSEGLPTKGRFFEADIPEDRVYVVDVDELLRGLNDIALRIASREEKFAAPELWDGSGR